MTFNEPFAKIKKSGFILFGGLFGAYFLAAAILFFTKLPDEATVNDFSGRLSMILFVLFVLIGLSVLAVGLFLLQVYACVDHVKEDLSRLPNQAEEEHDKGF
ncbi:MAG: hypothetical protein SPG64_05950 [Candidatus Enteromonas sp.]|nr:hypothetical protein [Candidatus Enteromonas sp.]